MPRLSKLLLFLLQSNCSPCFCPMNTRYIETPLSNLAFTIVQTIFIRLPLKDFIKKLEDFAELEDLVKAKVW